MLGSDGNGTVRAFAAVSSAHSKDIYQRYAAGLGRQAFLAHGDSALAEHVVRDVLAGECALASVPGSGEGDARYRLAESVFRRWQQLAADPAWRDCRPAQPPPGDVVDCVDPSWPAPEREGAGSALVGAGALPAPE